MPGSAADAVLSHTLRGARDVLQQRFRIDRLREVRIESRLQAFRAIALLPPPRYRDQSQVSSPGRCAQPSRKLVSR